MPSIVIDSVSCSQAAVLVYSLASNSQMRWTGRTRCDDGIYGTHGDCNSAARITACQSVDEPLQEDTKNFMYPHQPLEMAIMFQIY